MILTFEFNGIVYEFQELTLGQMELISGLLSGAKEALRKAVNDNENNEINIAISLNDVVNDLRNRKLLSRFVAVCMTQKGHAFNEQELAEREKAFKNLPYHLAEKTLAFFFNTGIFLKIVTPSFLILEAAEMKTET